MTTAARLSIVMVLLVGVASFAGAEIVSSSGSVSFTDLNQSATIYIPRFNVAGATLNNITVKFWDSGRADLSVTTGAQGISLISGQINRRYTATGTNLGFTNFTNSYIIPGNEWGPIAPNQTNLFLESIVFSNPLDRPAETFNITSDNFGYYAGSGNLSFLVTVPDSIWGFSNSSTVSGGDLQGTFSNSSLIVGTQVIYDYTQGDPGVPEPSSLALLPMALGGLMFWRRRRRTG